MHGRMQPPPDTGTKLDPVEVIMRLSRDLRGRGIRSVKLGYIELEFFEPAATRESVDFISKEKAENVPVDLDTYHLE